MVGTNLVAAAPLRSAGLKRAVRCSPFNGSGGRRLRRKFVDYAANCLNITVQTVAEVVPAACALPIWSDDTPAHPLHAGYVASPPAVVPFPVVCRAIAAKRAKLMLQPTPKA